MKLGSKCRGSGVAEQTQLESQYCASEVLQEVLVTRLYNWPAASMGIKNCSHDEMMRGA